METLIISLAVKGGLQSDERYTEVYVRQGIAEGFGPHRIVAELKHRGITDSLVHQYLPHDEMFWWEALSQFCKKISGAR
ncbi:RecX family transcriptional regulator [Candidatus Coxiella mudrowiae]|uniref:RecX family transcriptional regulator n=1 Tax=Candidatus Coxiella mudrowiae TaxID=2054173 RepID=UPI001FD4F501|nr:RecX family transcriptional regulator [Candidatus Coxiella mudrowiae]